MTVIFERTNCVEAWSAVSTHLLLNGHVDTNVVVVITDPLYFEDAWLTRFNPNAVKAKGDQIRDVMNTVFPQKTWQNAGNRLEFYDRYKKAHRRGKKKGWGTYFLRLIQFGKKEENQLDNAIRVLSGWKNNPHAAVTFHLSSPETDSIRSRGGPCWHYGEVLCPDKASVELVAVYRNHDYFNKALGNLIALARLLRFIGQETNRAPKRLVCHSVRAYYDASKLDFQTLLAR
jgi:thymidylate synthase